MCPDFAASLRRHPHAAKPIAAHAWQREPGEHYVEARWCSRRLFEVEPFIHEIADPACGFGHIADAARAAGHAVRATDIVDRGCRPFHGTEDFLTSTRKISNVCCNPPFDLFKEFARHALALTCGKVAMIWLTRRLNAARWLEGTPLVRVWLLSPRPSMPPGEVYRRYEAQGREPSGGTQDFCWLVWEHGQPYRGEMRWLRRDATAPAD